MLPSSPVSSSISAAILWISQPVNPTRKMPMITMTTRMVGSRFFHWKNADRTIMRKPIAAWVIANSR